MQWDANAEEVKIWRNVAATTARPCRCCGILCGLWVASIIVLAVLVLTLGGFAFEIAVPFYNLDDMAQQKKMALQSTQRDATAVTSFGESVENGNCLHQDPTRITRNGTLVAGPAPSAHCQTSSTMAFRLVFVAKDRKSNIFTPENLAKIAEIERKILDHPEFPRYCHLVQTAIEPVTAEDPAARRDEIFDRMEDAAARSTNGAALRQACTRISSVTNFMDPAYFEEETGLGFYLTPADAVSTLHDLSEANVNTERAFWAGYQTTSYNVSLPVAVPLLGNSITIPNLMQYTTSADYGGASGNEEAVGFISVINLGLPMNGYATSSATPDDQQKEAGVWLWTEFNDVLADAGFGDVDVFWADNRGKMKMAEAGYLAIQSFALIILSIVFVYVYMLLMLDSIFVTTMSMMQIFLCFVPAILIYTYVFGVEYFGVLNLCCTFIILGIGVDDIFVYIDTYNSLGEVDDRAVRLQKTLAHAGKAMLTTSVTTFMSFMANAASTFPAVKTFGIFAATLVLVNFCAVTTFFPAVYEVYISYIKDKWYDHPSKLCCFCIHPERGEKRRTSVFALTGHHDDEHHEGVLVTFFKERWGPWMVKGRKVILAVFAIVFGVAVYFAVQLEPDTEGPTTLQSDNNYVVIDGVIIDHFARTGNPRAIEVHWISGIEPSDPLDLDGVNEYNTTDFGKTVYSDCAGFNPAPTASQVWLLNTCHDAFFGNVTAYHDGDASFGANGTRGPGPSGRKVVDFGQTLMSEPTYRFSSNCVMQEFRDWLLTDAACPLLQAKGLRCMEEYNTTTGDCTYWPANGINSCEPFPVPAEHTQTLFVAMLLGDEASVGASSTAMNTLASNVLVDFTDEDDQSGKDSGKDFSCRDAVSRDGKPIRMYALDSTFTLTQVFDQSYTDGIALHDKWQEWNDKMLAHAPANMRGTMQISTRAWAWYFVVKTLMAETFTSIGLALALCFVTLSVATQNPYMSFLSVGTIILIIVDVFAFTVLAGYKLGVLEAINYVVVIGMSIDYCVHMAEAYTTAAGKTERQPRVLHMVGHMGVSVLSGAVSTLGCVVFMFFAPNNFFIKFASFMFVTIVLSCIYALVFFPALLACVGPNGDDGDVAAYFRRDRGTGASGAVLPSDDGARVAGRSADGGKPDMIITAL